MPRVLIANQPLYYRLHANDLTQPPAAAAAPPRRGRHAHALAGRAAPPARLERLRVGSARPRQVGQGRAATSIAAYRDVVYDFVQALGLERVVLAGHSMGGAIVLEFALHYPGRLAGIVLVGTGARLRVAPAILDGIRSDFPATAQHHRRLGA